MISHVIDFLVDYFTNLNAKKIFGGILVFLGIAIIGKAGSSGDTNSAIMYSIGGILIGGIGFVIVYYDIAKDKIGHGHDELLTLTKAYKQKEREEGKATAWHFNQESDEKTTPDNN